MLILIRGTSGAGKSTLATLLTQSMSNAVAVCSDDFMTDADGAYAFDPERLTATHTACVDWADRELSNGWVVIVHNVSPRAEHVQQYQQLAARHGVLFFSLLLEHRHAGGANAHGTPDYVIRRHAAELLYSAQLEADGGRGGGGAPHAAQ